MVASLEADRNWVEEHTARARTQSVCPLKIWKEEFSFHIFIVLSAEAVKMTISFTLLLNSSTSMAQIAAECPTNVETVELSCHTLAVLSQEALNMKPDLVTNEQTEKQTH